MTLGVKLKLGDAVSVRGQEEQGAGDPQGHRATRTWSLSLMNAVNPEDRPHSGFEAAEEEREEPGDRAGRGPSRTLTDTEERAEDEKKTRPELESQRGKTERRKRILRAEKRHLPTGSRTQQTPSRKSNVSLDVAERNCRKREGWRPGSQAQSWRAAASGRLGEAGPGPWVGWVELIPAGIYLVSKCQGATAFCFPG